MGHIACRSGMVESGGGFRCDRKISQNCVQAGFSPQVDLPEVDSIILLRDLGEVAGRFDSDAALFPVGVCR